MRFDSAKSAVDAGVAFLDERGPERWWDRVDADSLWMLDGSRCVLGQVYAEEAKEARDPNGYIFAKERLLAFLAPALRYDLNEVFCGYSETWRTRIRLIQAQNPKPTPTPSVDLATLVDAREQGLTLSELIDQVSPPTTRWVELREDDGSEILALLHEAVGLGLTPNPAADARVARGIAALQEIFVG